MREGVCVCVTGETHEGTLVPREEWKEIETDGKEGMGGTKNFSKAYTKKPHLRSAFVES